MPTRIKKDEISLEKAFNIVLDLAASNIIEDPYDDYEAGVAEEQQEAYDIVVKYKLDHRLEWK